MIPGKRYTAELVFAIARRRKWLILIPAVSIAVPVCVIIYRLPDRYRSEATIMVVSEPVADLSDGTRRTSPNEDRVRSFDQQVRTRSRLERIIDEFDLYVEQRKTGIMQDVLDDMSQAIDVQSVQDDVFRVAYTSHDARTSQQVTGRLASSFNDDRVQPRGERFLILEPARVPEKPTGPNRPWLYLAGVLAALAGGLLCAACAEYFDRGLRSEDDIRLALGLPVLATIPVIGSDVPDRPSTWLGAGRH